MTGTQLLKDPDIQPTADVLADALGVRQKAYTEFTEGIKGMGIDIEWRYYNDGRSWLGKGTRKGKTIFWLSVWEDFFQASIFFTEKTLPSTETKTVAVGKLIPVITKVRSEAELGRLFELIEYKKNLK